MRPPPGVHRLTTLLAGLRRERETARREIAALYTDGLLYARAGRPVPAWISEELRKVDRRLRRITAQEGRFRLRCFVWLGTAFPEERAPGVPALEPAA